MKLTLKLLAFSLAGIAAVTTNSTASPAPQAPITLEWSNAADPETEQSWHTGGLGTGTAGGRFIRLRVKGGVDDAGQWVRVVARVTFGSAFWDVPRDPMFLSLSAGNSYAMDQFGLPAQAGSPVCILSPTQLVPLLDEAWTGSLPDRVHESFEPLLRSSQPNPTEVVRKWSGTYMWWRQERLDEWGAILADRGDCENNSSCDDQSFDEFSINVRSLIESTVKWQTDGLVDRAFWGSAAAGDAVEAAITLELQAIALDGAMTNPNTYSTVDDPKPGGIQGWVAVGSSGPLTYTFGGSSGGDPGVNPELAEVNPPSNWYQPGDTVTLPMIGYFNDTRLLVNFGSIGVWLPAEPGPDYSTVQFTIPQQAVGPVICEVRAIINNYGIHAFDPIPQFGVL